MVPDVEPACSRVGLVLTDKPFAFAFNLAESGVFAGETDRTVSGVFARIVSGVFGGIGTCILPVMGEGVLEEAIAGCGIIFGETGESSTIN